MNTIPRSDELLDWYLRAKRDRWEEFRPQGRSLLTDGVPAIRASSLGNCLFAQHIQRTVEQPPREFDARTLRTFLNGDVIGKEIVRVYQRLGLLRFGPDVSGSETRLHDDELGLTGHVDAILSWPPQKTTEIPAEITENWSGDYLDWLQEMRNELQLMHPEMQDGWHTVVELKTTHSSALPKLREENAPRFHNGVQAGAYRLLAQRHPEQMPEGFDFERSEYRVDYVGKDTFGMLSFPVGQLWADEAERRCHALNRAVELGNPPDCSCAGWEVEYCALQTTPELTFGPRGGPILKFTCCDGRGENERRAEKGKDRDLLNTLGYEG